MNQKLHSFQEFLVCLLSVQKFLLTNQNKKKIPRHKFIISFDFQCFEWLHYHMLHHLKIQRNFIRSAKNFDWRLHFHKTLEQNNKGAAELITLVLDKFNVTIEAKHNLSESNYSSIISIQNSTSTLSQFLPLAKIHVKSISNSSMLTFHWCH